MKLLGAVLLAAVFASGCGEDFDPYNRLGSLRVLAVRSEPPAPAPGETAKLSALLYTTDKDPVVSVAWSWCPFAGSANDGYPCLLSEEKLRAMGGGDMVPPYDLGHEPEANFLHGVAPEALKAICPPADMGMGMGRAPAGMSADFLPSCDGGFPVTVKLVVKTAKDTVTAVRTVKLRIDPDKDANANPTVDGITAMLAGAERPVGEMPEVTLPRNQDTVIKVAVPEAAAERYMGKDDRGQPAMLRERIFVTWFVEAGATRSERTSFIDGVVALPDALSNKWKPPLTKDYVRDTSKLIIVVRDDRGGVAWTGGAVRLGAVK
jgi:hypothetical protein